MEVAEPPCAGQPRTLPMDLLLDIIERCDDAKTVVRCGLLCKELRRAMLDPGFHAHLVGRRRGFDPGLLVAVSYRLNGWNTENPIVVQPSGRLRVSPNLLRKFDPASSRDGPLALRMNETRRSGGLSLRHGIHVCNTVTGQVISLPRPSIGSRCPSTFVYHYQPALLSADADADAGRRSFELLIMWKKLMSGKLFTQTFSSRKGGWGAVGKVHFDYGLPPGVEGIYEASSSAPAAVVGRRVHWLCYTDTDSEDVGGELVVLAVRDESGCATVIKLPQELLLRMIPSSGWSSWWTSYPGKFMLAATVTAQGERRLSLVAAEPSAISMWTLMSGPDEGSGILWSRQEVIQRQEIDRPLTGVLGANQAIRFCMFGERTGNMLFWMQTGDSNHQAILVQLNLVTKKTQVLWRGSAHYCCDYTVHALLHETSLISVLKSF